MFASEYDKLQEALQFVKSKIGHGQVSRPKIGIVCGSGLGDLCNIINNPISIKYEDIPHFPQSTVVGHSGEFVFGDLDQIQLVCMRGRVHLYEGYDVVECIRPIRLMAMLGIKMMICTNAAGSVNKKFQPGDFMVIRDHISFPSLAGENPLRGPHDKRFGERFVTMSNAYDLSLIEDFEDVAAKCKLDESLKRGVYAMVVGPTYETIAEARALKMLGADTMGMSTVHEIIAAHQMGVRCLGVSLITNFIITEYDSMDDLVEHGHVVDMGKRRSKDFISLVTNFIKSTDLQNGLQNGLGKLQNGAAKLQNGNAKTNGINNHH